VKNLKPVNILKLRDGGCQCLSYRSLQERREGLEAFQTSLEEEQEEVEEEKKEDNDD
jgi:hypothetical protein